MSIEKIVAEIDQISTEIEAVAPKVALALDQVSDRLEGRASAIKDYLDIKNHEEDVKKYPGINHPTNIMEQVKSKLKDPKIEKKIEDYITKKHSSEKLKISNLRLLSGMSTGEGVQIHADLDCSDIINAGFFKEHNLQYVVATGSYKYATSIAVPLSVFEIE
jgi:hypothetical protein